MSNSPPTFPRFVPTLTEVVLPSSLAPLLNDNEALINSLTKQLSVVIERKVNDFGEELIRNLVTEQVQKMTVQLKLEIETAVRQAVQARYSGTSGPNKQK